MNVNEYFLDLVRDKQKCYSLCLPQGKIHQYGSLNNGAFYWGYILAVSPEKPSMCDKLHKLQENPCRNVWKSADSAELSLVEYCMQNIYWIRC